MLSSSYGGCPLDRSLIRPLASSLSESSRSATFCCFVEYPQLFEGAAFAQLFCDLQLSSGNRLLSFVADFEQDDVVLMIHDGGPQLSPEEVDKACDLLSTLLGKTLKTYCTFAGGPIEA